MREYVHSIASRQQESWLERALFMFRQWQLRRDFVVLLNADAAKLADLGLASGDIDYLLNLPLSVDMFWEADRLRYIASRKQVNKGRHFRQ